MRAIAFLALALLVSTQAHAWGKRGHSVVCQTAAYLAAKAPKGGFLKEHSFDLGYYCNVPDLVWKAPATYALEASNHFMDMEIFERGLKDTKIENPYALDRLAFNAAFPGIDDKAGRAWWRIRELLDGMTQLKATLEKTDLSKEARHAAQADWLVHAGAIGHYIGDLSQPLHVTENYDGQMTEQKGIHSYFEEAVVNEAFHSRFGDLETEVMKAAEKIWRKEQARMKEKDTLALLQQLTSDSNKALPELLKIDKRIGRQDKDKAVKAYRYILATRMAEGSVLLAELYRRQLGWDYNGEKFYTFLGAPVFIPPPTGAAASPASKTSF